MRKTYLIIGALAIVSVSIVAYCAYDQYCEARMHRMVKKQLIQMPVFAEINRIADSMANSTGNTTNVVVNFDGSNYATIGIKEKASSFFKKSKNGREVRYQYNLKNYAVVMFDESSGKILGVDRMGRP